MPLGRAVIRSAYGVTFFFRQRSTCRFSTLVLAASRSGNGIVYFSRKNAHVCSDRIESGQFQAAINIPTATAAEIRANAILRCLPDSLGEAIPPNSIPASAPPAKGMPMAKLK